MESAFLRYIIASELGYEVAQSNIAWMLDTGRYEYGSRNDSLKFATIYWNRAANQGSVDARVKMGDYYYYGLGVDPDHRLAHSYYQAAEAEQSAMAMYNIGYMHEHGLGITKDFHLAKRFYDRALQTNPQAYLPVTLALWKLHAKHFWTWIWTGGPFLLDTPMQKAEKDGENAASGSNEDEDGGLADLLKQQEEMLKDRRKSRVKQSRLDDDDVVGSSGDNGGEWSEEDMGDDSELLFMLILIVMTAILMWARVQPPPGQPQQQQNPQRNIQPLQPAHIRPAQPTPQLNQNGDRRDSDSSEGSAVVDRSTRQAMIQAEESQHPETSSSSFGNERSGEAQGGPSSSSSSVDAVGSRDGVTRE